MKRSLSLLAVAVLAGCQDYQFVKVGRCLLQPGSASVGSASAVDILFVVDDSFSMDTFQTRLADNFGTFINRLARKQQDRVADSKTPFDIYIAVTTTSVLANRYNLTTGATAGECNANNWCELGQYSCVQGDHCAKIETSYYNVSDGCKNWLAKANGDPFPAGHFTASGSNPTVLSFTKNLKWASASTDQTIQGLIEQFKANVKVGSCGSNQEMPFEAARRAIELGLGNKQGVVWPHENSKIAVIFVSNEDDCSTTEAKVPIGTDPSRLGLVWVNSPESCRADVAGPASASHLIPNEAYASFFTGLGRPLSLAFVRPGAVGSGGSRTNPCQGDADAGGPGTRTEDLANKLKNQGISTIEASVCSDFAATLEQIADSLPPPDHIQLPTIPVEAALVRLQIIDAQGALVRVCAEKTEWYFVNCLTDQTLASGTSQCVKISASSACAPQPGETLQAEYLGRVPQNGCRVQADCATALGGNEPDWICNDQGSCECASQSGH